MIFLDSRHEIHLEVGFVGKSSTSNSLCSATDARFSRRESLFEPVSRGSVRNNDLLLNISLVVQVCARADRRRMLKKAEHL